MAEFAGALAVSGMGKMRLEIQGLGIILYSPRSAAHIKEGEDYLASNYTTGDQVVRHVMAGTIVGFGTGSPGTFELYFSAGYPDDGLLRSSEFKLRLGLQVQGGIVCIRDLYDLLDWTADCPSAQQLPLADGFYHVTLCSRMPKSGVLGDDQRIDIYLQPLPAMPALSFAGVPVLSA